MGKIVVRKCTTGEEVEDNGRKYWEVGGVTVLEKRADYQHWCEILDVSDDCKLFDRSHIGAFVQLPEFKPNDIYRIGDTEDSVVREDLFERNEAPALIVRT